MNRQDLISLIRQGGRRRPPRRPRRLAQPDPIRLAYFTALQRSVLADLQALLKFRVLPKLAKWAADAARLRGDGMRADAGEFDDGDVQDTFDALAEELAKKWTSKRFASVVQPFAQDTARMSREQLSGMLRDQIGIDVLASEPNLAPMAAEWTQRNVALIKRLPGQALQDIEGRLLADLHSGQRWESMAKMIEDRYSVTESRANLIARDQVGKLYGQINEARQKDLGITGYTWRTVTDNRVRELHEEREGVHFEWDDPPTETADDGHPGEPIQCRCYAEPDMGPLFEEAWAG